jgi:hypothetical protein
MNEFSAKSRVYKNQLQGLYKNYKSNIEKRHIIESFSKVNSNLKKKVSAMVPKLKD